MKREESQRRRKSLRGELLKNDFLFFVFIGKSMKG
jgi:hypothetical protein